MIRANRVQRQQDEDQHGTNCQTNISPQLGWDTNFHCRLGYFGCTKQLLHSLHTALVTLYVPQSHISAKIGGLLSAWFIKPRA